MGREREKSIVSGSGSGSGSRRGGSAPSLVDLCVDVALYHRNFIGNVGETEFHLLDRILPHCTSDQLARIEKSTPGRDLSPVTDKLWKAFYTREFGKESCQLVVQRMEAKNVSFKWKQLYEAKLKDVDEAQEKLIARCGQLYKKDLEEKQSRQIRLISKVPSSSKRSFFGSNGPGYNFSNVKSKIMKKAKLDFVKSREVQNIAAMKKNAVQRSYSSPSMKKPGGFTRENAASSSKQAKVATRKF